YEEYPQRIYGLEAGFYWYRLWFKVDKDIREAVTNANAVADSPVYSSVALFLTGFFWLLYAGLSVLLTVPNSYLPRAWVCISLSIASFGLAYLAYEMSIHMHEYYGNVFKSVVDLYEKDIDVAGAVKQVSAITEAPWLGSLPRKEQLTIAWMYLHNYRINCPFCGKVLTPLTIRGHYTESRHGPPLYSPPH